MTFVDDHRRLADEIQVHCRLTTSASTNLLTDWTSRGVQAVEEGMGQSSMDQVSKLSSTAASCLSFRRSVSAKDNNDTAFTEDSANQAKAAGDQASIKAAIKAEHEVETKSVEIANEIAAKVKEIEEDASIPTRASKKNPISELVAR